MLGTFQKIFPMRQLPKGIFPSVQFPKRQLPKSVLAAGLAPPLPVLAAALGDLDDPSRRAQPPLRRLRGPNLAFGKLPLGKLHI